MSLYTLVIVNPASANGATARRWPALREALDRVLTRWDSQFTAGPGDATRLAREGVLAGYEQIVSVGGDGTMNEVVTGLFPDVAEPPDAPIRGDLVLSPIRQGTGGDFARLLGLSGTLPGCVKHLAGTRSEPVDLGVVEFERPDGGRGWRAFLNISSFGMSGMVVNKVNGSSKALGGGVSFAMGLGKALLAYRPQLVVLRVDGQEVYRGPLVTAAIANGQFFGGGMHIAPRARFDDGLLDVTIQTRSGLKEVLSIGDLYGGRVLAWDSVHSHQGRVIDAEPEPGESPVLMDVDGEQPGRLPARFRVLPGAVRLKSPRTAE